MSGRSVKVEEHTRHSLELLSPPRLEIISDLASIRIRSGEPRRLTVEAVTRAWATDEGKAKAGLERVRLEVRATERGARIHSRAAVAATSGLLRKRKDCRIEVDLLVEADIRGLWQVSAEAGDLRVDRVDGSLTGRLGSGNVIVGEASGPVDLKIGAGSVHARQTTGPISLRLGSGNVLLEDLRGRFDIVAQSGSVRARLSSPPDAASQIHSDAGTLVLQIGEAVGVDLIAKTDAGRVLSELPLTSRAAGASAESSGSLNGGGTPVHLRTRAGNILLSGPSSPW